MNIQMRQGTIDDLPAVKEIIRSAQLKLAASGSPQWSGEDAPSEARLRTDMEDGNHYVFLINQQIIGTAALTKGQETAYETIVYGQWEKNDADYAVIHRFAILPERNGRGYAALFFKLLLAAARESGMSEVRIDTHPLNRAMQKVITNHAFQFKGIIHLPIPHGERYAYQVFL
ncbi:GNAT family N-acetyltransferase [Halobacillus sp. BAB-2008]|uniref:GNAT family N-acetyltransferase n=1 Tax=Halobacillus sp. BAB-2008 TaxID=1246484 RepID=UPI0002A51547|nr:GNAT family N-acetyltransferase [Halobacillus sp. BAB-2008]ELK45955.1 acetyltransferase [Halobacillus sp. BAB-2008]